MFDKFLVKRGANRLLLVLNGFRATDPGTADLVRWRRSAESHLRSVFGDNSDLLTRLQLIPLAPGFRTSEEGEQIWTDESAAEKRRMIDDLAAVMREVSNTLDTVGVPFGYRAPVKELWVSHGITLVVGAALMFLGVWVTGYVSRAEDEKRTQREAAVLVTDFRNWYEMNNSALRPALDSITDNQAGCNRLYAGQSVKQIVDFAEDFRRRRDNTIDSFFVRLRSLGVETDTLGVRRRLPVNIHNYLKPRLDQLQLDEPRVNRLGLDTL